MKKLKLEKIKLSELTLDDQKNIIGGTHPTTTTISIVSLIVCTVTSTAASKVGATCLTNKPGAQNSCGLCDTNNACPQVAQQSDPQQQFDLQCIDQKVYNAVY